MTDTTQWVVVSSLTLLLLATTAPCSSSSPVAGAAPSLFVWPLPQHIQTGTDVAEVSRDLQFVSGGFHSNLLAQAYQRYKRIIFELDAEGCSQSKVCSRRSLT